MVPTINRHLAIVSFRGRGGFSGAIIRAGLRRGERMANEEHLEILKDEERVGGEGSGDGI